MFKTVVVAYDGSAGAERVLLYAEHLARLEAASVVVVHAYEVPQIYRYA